MTIYAAGERWVLHRADARDVLAEIATESLDLVVTDPPYGKEWRSNRRVERFDQLAEDGRGDREGVREVLEHTVRLVGQHRHLYVFGPDDVLDGLKVTAPVRLVWDKGTPGSGNLSAPWGPQHEEISFLVSKNRHAGEAGKDSIAARRRKGSVLRFTRQTGRKVRHPSEKPIALLRELIESSSRAGETVLDPFAGIASTGVAAVLAGRKAVLVEIDERYAEIGAERLRKAEALAIQAEGL